MASLSVDEDEFADIMRQAQEFDQQRICKKVKVADRVQPLKRTVMEQKFRQEKLETPLDSSNKGFQLLQKIISCSGAKSSTNTLARMSEHIPINIRKNRTGLGAPDALLHKSETENPISLFNVTDLNTQQYIANLAANDRFKRLSMDLRRCLRVLQGFIESHLQSPDIPETPTIICGKRVHSTLDYDHYNKRDTPSLSRISEACDVDYNDDWIRKNTGTDEQRFFAESHVGDDNTHAKTPDVDMEVEFDVSSLEPTEVEDCLFALLIELRAKHNYCYYCGCKFDSSSDMDRNCPGISDRDH